MPNTREKLMDLIEQGRNKGNEMCGKQDGCDKCKYQAPKGCVWGLIADHLIANGVTFATDNNIGDKWISVKERLPENDYGKHWKERKYYLVRYEPSGLMCVAHYGYKEYDWWIDGHDCVLSATNFKEVTHWMEINNLPQPPKGE